MLERFRSMAFEAMKERGMTLADLSRAVGIDYAYLARMLKGKARLNEDHLDGIARELGLPAYGQTPSPPPSAVIVRAPSLRVLKDLPERRTELLEVPVAAGAVAAGPGRFIEPEDISDWAWIPVEQLHGRDRDNLVCVKVDGDSMAPVVRDGAMVCVDRSERPTKKAHTGDAIYAVLHGGKVSVKYVRFTDQVMVLVSANTSYPPMIVDLRDNPSPVIGRVIWIWQSA